MAYKFIFSLLCILIVSCSEIERDNILDPKNPESKRDRVVLLEAFINTGNPFEYNQYALDAIAAISADNDIQEHLIIAEYHRDTQQFSDSLEADSFNTENIYNRYIQFDAQRFKGVPDLFLNGAEDRVQGASSASNVRNRVKDLAMKQLLQDGQYTIEVDFELNGSVIEGTYRVARLGNQAADATLLRMLITYNSGLTGQRTVSRVVSPLGLKEIESGEYLEDTFTINNVPSGKAERLLVILKDETGLRVLHAIEREI